MTGDVMTADEALQRLRDGNARFVAHALGVADVVNHTRFADLAYAQHPFAVILGCSDSRVPAELVFDQGLGELFVIRVAGNIAAESQIGSVEYAVTQLGTPLVVVLGHTNCGAVTATVEALTARSRHGSEDDNESDNIKGIVEFIRPSVEPLLGDHDGGGDQSCLVEKAVRANVYATVRGLQQNSRIISDRVDNGALRVVGAEYSLENGEVAFL